jgi:hypothetical protein
MTSSNFLDTAPPSVIESTDPATVIAWIRSLPLHAYTGKALLCEWATRNNITLNATHYAAIGNPLEALLHDNLSKLPRP